MTWEQYTIFMALNIFMFLFLAHIFWEEGKNGVTMTRAMVDRIRELEADRDHWHRLHEEAANDASMKGERIAELEAWIVTMVECKNEKCDICWQCADALSLITTHS